MENGIDSSEFLSEKAKIDFWIRDEFISDNELGRVQRENRSNESIFAAPRHVIAWLTVIELQNL